MAKSLPKSLAVERQSRFPGVNSSLFGCYVWRDRVTRPVLTCGHAVQEFLTDRSFLTFICRRSNP